MVPPANAVECLSTTPVTNCLAAAVNNKILFVVAAVCSAVWDTVYFVQVGVAELILSNVPLNGFHLYISDYVLAKFKRVFLVVSV